MKKIFPILKKATNASYLPSLIMTSFALFRYAHITQLNPGFELMSFAMKSFAGAFLFSLSIFFTLFLLRTVLENRKNK